LSNVTFDSPRTQHSVYRVLMTPAPSTMHTHRTLMLSPRQGLSLNGTRLPRKFSSLIQFPQFLTRSAGH
jgi:hypothetical protein